MTSRWKASAVHLALSATAAAAVFATMYFVWYPGPFFTAMGGNDLVMILIGVDVVLGPLITLIVFSPGKARHLLRLDLAVIGTVQAAALAYGILVISEARPVYMVFTVDRFDLVAANDLKPEELARVTRPEFKDISWGRPRTVAVRSPTNPEEQFRVIQSALAGSDLQTFPQYFVPYAELAAEALERSKPAARLRKAHPEEAAEIDAALRRAERGIDDVRYLPLKARARDYSVLLDAKTGAILGFAKVNPW
jgi:hypothetical protein